MSVTTSDPRMTWRTESRTDDDDNVLVLATPAQHRKRGWWARTSDGHRVEIRSVGPGRVRVTVTVPEGWTVAAEEEVRSIRIAKGVAPDLLARARSLAQRVAS